MPRKTVLFVFPTSWDHRQLEACRGAWESAFDVGFTEPTHEDCPWDMDVPAFVDETVERYRGSIHGVTSSSDYPGATAAAAIAARLGLPGPDPDRVIRTSHKFASRTVQAAAAPEATPRFALVDARRPEEAAAGLFFPCFVKPVKGAFSVHARRVETADDLVAFLRSPPVVEFTTVHMQMFNRVVAEWTDLEADGHFFIAEELIGGRQATVEGFLSARSGGSGGPGGTFGLTGIVDSILHPQTGSFVRFDYPSTLPEPVQARMADAAEKSVRALGLGGGLFNIEMTWDEATDRVRIIEVNPRLCGQYGDLYQKVDGTNGYEIALTVATGGVPRIARGAGPFGAASSYPLRVFEPVRILAAPDEAAARRAERDVPGTLVWPECEAGADLSDFDTLEDGHSARYAVVNVGGADRAGVEAECEKIVERLGYRFEPIERPGSTPAR